MINKLTKAFSGFGRELVEDLRQSNKERLDDAALEEKINGIKRATVAMIEVGVERTDIIYMLQKHWDLRLSEAEYFIDNNQNE